MMTFKQLTLLAEDDFMSGMEEYEKESNKIYFWHKDSNYIDSKASIEEFLQEYPADMFKCTNETFADQINAGKWLSGKQPNRWAPVIYVSKIKQKVIDIKSEFD